MCKSQGDFKATKMYESSFSLSSLWIRKAKEEEKKVTFKKWFFPLPLKERGPHWRITYLPRSLWQHFPSFQKHMYLSFLFSLGVCIWPFCMLAAPPPSLTHKIFVNFSEPLSLYCSGNTKEGQCIIIDLSEVIDFAIFFSYAHVCIYKHTPIRGWSEYKTVTEVHRQLQVSVWAEILLQSFTSKEECEWDLKAR